MLNAGHHGFRTFASRDDGRRANATQGMRRSASCCYWSRWALRLASHSPAPSTTLPFPPPLYIPPLASRTFGASSRTNSSSTRLATCSSACCFCTASACSSARWALRDLEYVHLVHYFAGTALTLGRAGLSELQLHRIFTLGALLSRLVPSIRENAITRTVCCSFGYLCSLTIPRCSYALIGAFFVLFYSTIPPTGKFRLWKLPLTDKIFIYLLCIQVRACRNHWH